jgi:23S rRNA (adenine2503-C2)-methyltransferase
MQHLRNLSIQELETFITGFDERPYRSRQTASWLYRKLAMRFSEMTDLPASFRETLEKHAFITSLETRAVELSKLDGTRKFLFRLADGELIESVLMRHEDRITLCISTQVGCPLDCVFCRTGQGGFRRNCTAGEILDQVCVLRSECAGDAEKVNIVFMGMGEPLLNYREVVKAIRVLLDPLGMNLASKRLTVSTSGIPDGIKALADDGIDCLLAISLNAPTDEKRRRLMPALARYSIASILEAARYFHGVTRRRITLEYVLLRGINTTDEDALALGRLTRRGPYKINLIPFNGGTGFETVDEQEIDRFIKALLPFAPAVTVRRSRGSDIQAACGQLWTENLAKRVSGKGPRDARGGRKARDAGAKRKVPAKAPRDAKGARKARDAGAKKKIPAKGPRDARGGKTV